MIRLVHVFRIIFILFFCLSMSCKKQPEPTLYLGRVFTSTNRATGNQIITFARNLNTGQIGYLATNTTKGIGYDNTVDDGGNAVILSPDNQWVFAVNKGDTSLSAMVDIGGILVAYTKINTTTNNTKAYPISIANFKNQLIYVLNEGINGVAPSIIGFFFNNLTGKLTPIASSFQYLGGSTAGGFQIDFLNNGANLLITNNENDKIYLYAVNALSGLATIEDSLSITNVSGVLVPNNPTFFGFSLSKSINTVAYISIASDNASNSQILPINIADGKKIVAGTISDVIPISDLCWLADDNNDQYVYGASYYGRSLVSFKINGTEKPVFISSVAIGTNGQPVSTISTKNDNTSFGLLDVAISPDAKFLYNLASPYILVFSINNGTFNFIQSIYTSNLDSASMGLSVY